ncbi:MAG: tetratricopeptide repeat protein [Proteobacteria bacterium]|nr:tetratricopeptide repeat protein [Pseudomonadota bacterium]
MIAFIFALSTTAEAASYYKAVMLSKHGLVREAKAELIDVIYSKAPRSYRAKSYYYLGTLDFNENNLRGALEVWTELVRKFPSSEEATIVASRLDELAEMAGEVLPETTENAVAATYLRHGDFWSKRKAENFTIDSSWIETIEAATRWYDRVITEFPNSSASRIAYRSKLMTLLGWQGAGGHGAYGIMGDMTKYMPKFLETFEAFEAAHPEAPSLQGFRFQIAQSYWMAKEWDKTREWLTVVIKEAGEKSGDDDSFYSDLAKRRLEHIEY